MQARPSFSVALVILGLGGLACGSARDVTDTGGQVLNSCTTCHGGQDNATGAPPFDTAGRSDPTLASVGAHTAHVQAGAVAGAFGCGVCHAKSTTVTSPEHGDGKVEVTFGGRSTANDTLTPRYDAQRGGCSSTYCHGAFAVGNPNNIPIWTAGPAQAACGSCHGDPTATASALPRVHVRLAAGATNATCSVCHPATVKADGTVDVAGGKHVNGEADVDPESVHSSSWMSTASPNFHGKVVVSAGTFAPCLRCHTTNDPPRVAALTCNYCHDIIGIPIPAH